MRQVIRMHRTLVVLAVGLLALAAPLIASASGPGPSISGFHSNTCDSGSQTWRDTAGAARRSRPACAIVQ